MHKKTSDILIVGAGLTGLCLAYYLRNTELSITILEARDRLGGRILTKKTKLASIEMGATWLGDHHSELQQLIRKLKLETFVQELGTTAIYQPSPNAPHQVVVLPENQEPSYRIKGGSEKIIDALLNAIDPGQIKLNEQVLSIEEDGEDLITSTSETIYRSRWVISTLPPNLFVKSIRISPELPPDLVKTARNTHTWMGESIKIGLSYQHPFWKEKGTSGTVFSNSAPVPEMYDHSNFEQSTFALKGFLNGALQSLNKQDRIKAILTQLKNYYGTQVEDYLDYQELLWMNERFTYSPYTEQLFPHQNNGHQVYRSSYIHNKLIIAGTETAAAFPGYMEGAVRSAQEVFKLLKGYKS